MEALLDVHGVRASFGARTVLEPISLRVEPGQFWAILGPNGAGKSTFIRTCLGLHPLDEGRVDVLGRPQNHWTRTDLSRVAAWVPQGLDVIPGFSGLELVMMGRNPHRGFWTLPSERDQKLALDVLRELDAENLAARNCAELSGGERRLLLVARAFVQDPKLLFLDEPTAFLDLHHQVQALERVRVRVQNGLSAVAVLHDVNWATAFADHVLLLRSGKVLASGPTEKIVTREALEALYGLPMVEGTAEGRTFFIPRMST